MIKLRKIQRLIRIQLVVMRYVFNRAVLDGSSKFLYGLSFFNPWSYLSHGHSRGESIYLAFVRLGPLFVKFGQILSTRNDLFPDDIVEELVKLQDRVPAFLGARAVEMIEKNYKKKIHELFSEFNETALASASIAQVHTAKLHDGSDVVVKVLRPNIKETIKQDVSLLYSLARLVERFWRHGKRLRPVELVREYDNTITDEQDLMREAANASQLRRNFEGSDKMYVPKIHWGYASQDVLVMERIHGVQISDIETLKKHNVNMKRLAEYGVEIFFTQVFRDSFFHADMHPGNLFVDISDPEHPRYLGVDFGIMGTLSPEDQHYIAKNLLAFFMRDYRKVAALHTESGWVPSGTRVDQFESAIRTVCEPIFEKPLKDISFGQLLLRLFQTAERFDMEIQPQLMLLQKTLLNIESLGRKLYPELDLWETAKPFMEQWVKEKMGPKSIAKEFFDNWSYTTQKIIRTPEALFEVLGHVKQHFEGQRSEQQHRPVMKKSNSKQSFLIGAGAASLVAGLVMLIHRHGPVTANEWIQLGVGGALILTGWLLTTD